MANTSWIAYVPVPGSALVPAYAERHDRLHRYHARQGGLLVGLLWLGLLLVGLLARASEAPAFTTFIGIVALLWLLAGTTGVVWGMAGAARGRFVRVRPVWDLLVVLRR